MSWEYVNFDYPVPNLFEKHLIWISTNCHMYFAMKLNDSDSWTYYAGDASHNLLSGKLLTSYGSNETSAQTNYLLTNKDSNNKVLAILPTIIQARYIRMYIESGSSVTIYEWVPSTKLTAHEIITGDLEITDELSEAPKITITSSSVERLKIGNITGNTYGIVGYNSTSATVFELSDANQTIAGLNITNTLLQNGNDIIIDSSNKKISINSSVFSNSGIQLDYNSGVPRAYIGNGSDQYFNFDGTNISWKGVNTELSTSGKLTVSDIDANGGTVGGWVLSDTKIESDTTGTKVVLNQDKNRISIYSYGTEKVVMGYLDGLTKNASPSQQWGPDDYGFYAVSGDHLKIDGNASYISGDWIIENDAAYKVVDNNNNVIIKMGTDSDKKGMFIYSTLGSQLAEYSDAGITIGDVSSSQYMKYTVTDGAIFRGGLNADDIIAGTLSADRIGANTITATEIKADTITSNEIAADTITATEIKADTITSNEIAADTITSNEIAANTITATEIKVSELSAITASIGTVTSGKIQSSNYNASDAGMEINLDDAKMSIYEASGLVIQSNAGILMYTASNAEPSYINTVNDTGSIIPFLHGENYSIYIGEDAGGSSGNRNIGIGYEALHNNTAGFNTCVGYKSLYSNTTGGSNTGIGYGALINNTTGNSNTGVGVSVLANNTIGYSNTSVGVYSLFYNASGYDNVGIGRYSLFYNISGYQNTGVGGYTLSNNTTGFNNTSIGYRSLYTNTTAYENTSVGYRNMELNTTGIRNTSIGGYTLNKNTTGDSNTGVGCFSLYENTTGYKNTVVGYSVLRNNTIGNNNTGIGYYSLYYNASGDNNTALGAYANFNGSAYQSGGVYIGYMAGYNEKNSSRLYISNSDTASPLIYGEFDNKFITIHDVIRLNPISAAPSSPLEGMIYANSSDHELYHYNGTSWKKIYTV